MHKTPRAICTYGNSAIRLAIDHLVVLVKHIIERLIDNALVNKYTRDTSFHAKDDVVDHSIGSVLSCIIPKITALEKLVLYIVFDKNI
jgi:hypothetical protein